MADLRKEKTPMPEQEPSVRRHNWDEVASGYTEEMAVLEAGRCIQCKNPACMSGCPVGVSIPAFIKKITEKKYTEAYDIIKGTNALPAVCGRVCPQERQCESKCVRGRNGESVGIGRLERFCADYADRVGYETKSESVKKNGKRVAVVGSGPSSITCAVDLAKKGFDVTVFEALHTAGGVLVYGIPEFRLPKAIVKKEIEKMKNLGVKLECDAVIGRTETVDELFSEGYDAVFIGTGAGLPKFLGIPGESAKGVYSANEFLTRINLMKAYRDDYATPVRKHKKVAVVGGGNVAMDAARSALRLGAKDVYIIYRRGKDELPARAEEVHHASEEGVEFCFLTNPKEIHADENGNVCSVTCRKTELGEPDASGRRSAVEIEGSEFDIEVDAVICALGSTPNPLIRMTTGGIEADRRGCLIVKEDGVSTTRDGVFAGGDAVTGAATVILAMGAGRSAAKQIEEYLK